ncbi:MAG: 16S rRNA (cytosine(1402)-N(4))-methyltransferase RsmH [Bacteroidota bacterium]
MNETNYHQPVLLHESINWLNIQPHGVYFDVTFGGGGHSREILNRIGENGKLFSFDQDTDAVANSFNAQNFTLVQSNFKFIKQFAQYFKVDPIDGILADLGVSSHQFDTSNRGFSIRFDSKLDMRMNSNQKLGAYEVVNEYSEEALSKIIFEYGEINQSKKLSAAIVEARKKKNISTTQQLCEIAAAFTIKKEEHNFFAQLFQAIRIEVNQEIDVLKDMLLQSAQILKPGGRLVVISYHSLEDRLVKNLFKTGNLEGNGETDVFGNKNLVFKELTKKPITPGIDELRKNNRSRSAKLRVGEKI